MSAKLSSNGIGTNTALLVGHGSLREQVMGRAERYSTAEELKEMSTLMVLLTTIATILFMVFGH